MNEKQFLMKLNNAIKGLPSDERQDILNDYEEHFSMGKEEGKTEEEIAAALGIPNKIAKELLAMYHLEKAETHVSTGNMLRAVWAGIGLGFLNLIIVLGPFIALIGVVLAGWVTGLAFIISPLLVPVNLLIYPGTFEPFDLFSTIILCGLGLFIVIGMYYLTKVLTNVFVRYLKFNTSLVKGGLSHG